MAEAIGQKATPEQRKSLRKTKRRWVGAAANSAMQELMEELALRIPHTREGHIPTMPSIKDSTSMSLAALIRLNRRFNVIVTLAQRELERRFRDEDKRRRKLLKNLYKEEILKKLEEAKK
jgi:hypothetical protein